MTQNFSSNGFSLFLHLVDSGMLHVAHRMMSRRRWLRLLLLLWWHL